MQATLTVAGTAARRATAAYGGRHPGARPGPGRAAGRPEPLAGAEPGRGAGARGRAGEVASGTAGVRRPGRSAGVAVGGVVRGRPCRAGPAGGCGPPAAASSSPTARAASRSRRAVDLAHGPAGEPVAGRAAPQHQRRGRHQGAEQAAGQRGGEQDRDGEDAQRDPGGPVALEDEDAEHGGRRRAGTRRPSGRPASARAPRSTLRPRPSPGRRGEHLGRPRRACRPSAGW